MYSLEHKNYLKKIKFKKYIIRFVQLSILVFLLVLWQFLADKGLINTFISSSPKKVVETIINLHKTNSLYPHIMTTLYETLISFSLGTFIGFLIAIFIWWFDFFDKVIDLFLTIINSLPKVALGPIIIIWVGANINAIIVMALLISVIITIINISSAFKETDKNKIKLMRSFHANKFQTFYKLVLPYNIKSIISTLKISISMNLIGIIMGEFLVSKKGIGYLIMYGSQVFNLNLVISGIVLLCIISTIMYYLVLYLEKKIKGPH